MDFKNMESVLSRTEMRAISGGINYLDDGGGVPCPTEAGCTSDSQCTGSCGGGTAQYCAQLSCTPSWGGVYNYKKCTCH